MGRSRPLLRVLQIALSAVATLLVVPFAVNISTGGDPPGWMRSFVGWLWPVAIGCVFAVIVLEAIDRLAPATHDKVIRHRVGDPRNIPLALAQVTRYVSARQQGSLAERVRIALALDERPTAVRQPAHLVARVSGDVFTLSPDLGIADVFGQLHESMLILGAPGAGKTTQLLDLAAALAGQAPAADPPFIPVLLDLADWARPRGRGLALLRPGDEERPPFDRWVVSAMAARYLIGEEIGAAWLADDRIALLLDGLDEVSDNDRARCVAEINALGVTRVAVCCREADYDQVGAQLRLQGAVTIRPLTRDQVRTFLAAADPSLAEVMAGLDGDDELWEVLTTPLMLSITVLANADRAAFAGSAEPTTRRRLLFDAYVVEVLSRRRAGAADDTTRILVALRSLAAGATRGDAGVRVVAFDTKGAYDLLPDRALSVTQRWLLPIAGIPIAGSCIATMAARTSLAATVLPALFILAIVVVLVFLPASASVANRAALVGYSAACLAVGVVPAGGPALTGLVHPTRAVAAGAALGIALLCVAMIWWFDRAAMDRGNWILVATCAGTGAVGAVAILLFGYSPAAGAGWAVGVATIGALVPLLAVAATIPAYRAARRGFDGRLVALLLVFVAGTATALVLIPAGTAPFWAATTGWLAGLVNGFGPAYFLVQVIFVPVARAALAVAGEPSPWRRPFLRFAADRGLLTYTDGEYRFIHLLVRDHLASCDPAGLAAQVSRRKEELASPVPAHREPVA
ncbi:MAG TPA: hypothetical protein VGP16_12320 [Asanoa sp.]|nr:hypothetical protein [Asanoa sp.]